jgi:hypothetical protein
MQVNQQRLLIERLKEDKEQLRKRVVQLSGSQPQAQPDILKLTLQVAQLQDNLQSAVQERDTFKNLLEQKSDFQSLTAIVSELTGMLISKNVKEMSAQQK